MIQSVDRSVRILLALQGARRLSLADLSARLKLPASTVHGILATLAAALPRMVVPDTWLALVDGRWIAQHGLPHSDSIAVWTRGATWVDQQWLAHLSLYGIASAGGVKLVLAAALLEKPRRHRAGRDQRDPDTGPGEFVAEAVGQRRQTAFGSGVHRLVPYAHQTGDGTACRDRLG